MNSDNTSQARLLGELHKIGEGKRISKIQQRMLKGCKQSKLQGTEVIAILDV